MGNNAKPAKITIRTAGTQTHVPDHKTRRGDTNAPRISHELGRTDSLSERTTAPARRCYHEQLQRYRQAT
eukprot:CAMPEP_0183359016 /NCGR_PEP_ID=MMETSP0164_2-20130417/50996_1 /TAXON_ID=221442 /ORGANISM="Coccolithus pelagicus ssp braarudi, Strain PLY182g" /LENGTH=69 /DNA_ID=CAMNT_0025533035 /DNA_START=315 /DNA_END=521 /DNA_ORIENTATION=-